MRIVFMGTPDFAVPCLARMDEMLLVRYGCSMPPASPQQMYRALCYVVNGMLASKSAESAKSITSLIDASVRLVEYGTTLSEETTQALSQVVSSSQQSEELVGQIAQSAQMQALSLRQLTEGMEMISGVVQTNAATAEESASSACELSQQAEKLQAAVRHFRLRT